jgi:hypothetical protein
MGFNLGDLAVRVGADMEPFKRDMQKGAKHLRGFGKQARETSNDIVKMGLASASAAAVIAGALVAKSAQAAKELRTLAQVSDTNVEQFQKMAYAAKGYGIEQDKLSDILKDTKDRVGDFISTGGGPMADFFENIAPLVGVTADNFKKLSGPDALQLYVSSLEKANVSQSEMTFYMEAMASDATNLLPLLRDGGAALAKQAEEAEALGLALDSVDVSKLATLGKDAGKAAGVVDSFVENLSADLAPILSDINEEFLDWAKGIGGAGEAADETFGFIIEAAGFVANAVAGTQRVFEVLGKTVGVIALGINEAFLQIADFIVNRPIDAVNELIDALNTLPWHDIENVGLSGWGETIRSELDVARGAVREGLADIHETLMRPLPAEAFKKYVRETTEAADVLAESQAEKRAANIAAQNDDDLLLSQMLADGENIRWKIAAEAGKAQVALQEAEAQARQAALGDMMTNLSTLMQGKSKKMFKIGKMAAAANTVLSTYEGAQKAYTSLAGIPIVGPGLGAAAAGAAIAAGLVRLQSIKAQQFGGGASISSGGSVGGSVGSAGGVTQAGATAASQTHYVQGISPDSLYTGAQVVDLVNKGQAEGARLVIL